MNKPPESERPIRIREVLGGGAILAFAAAGVVTTAVVLGLCSIIDDKLKKWGWK